MELEQQFDRLNKGLHKRDVVLYTLNQLNPSHKRVDPKYSCNRSCKPNSDSKSCFPEIEHSRSQWHYFYRSP